MTLKKFLTLLVALMMMSASADAAQKILFIPHDDRPVSRQQPIDVVETLGYEILTPPLEFLTQPEKLWQWLDENAPSANAAVVASDALLYGGLIPSRSHNIPAEELQARVEMFKSLREKNPRLQLYAFGSLMRTPQFGTPGDREEPDYYGQYGADIFQYTALVDKQETSKLNGAEKNYLDALHKKIPAEILSDYFARREKNFNATKQLIDFANADIINCLIIGRDDNAPLSQTHRENRQLLAYMEKLNVPKTKAQSHAGIDEYAMLLLARAVNDLRGDTPKVHVKFNRGVGEKTVPAYSDEMLGQSVRDEILLAGGKFVTDPNRADFVLFINTDPKGKTLDTHNSLPPQTLTERQQRHYLRNAKKFSSLIEDAVKKDLPVGVADVTFANGSDVALMNQLRDKNLLFRLHAYAGWNTATNTTGFVMGAGILSRDINRYARSKLLATRYLDDWGYQTFVRPQIAAELSKRPDGLKIYLNFGEHEPAIVVRENELIRLFAEKNLPPLEFLQGLKLTNPWHRMFECSINFDGENS